MNAPESNVFSRWVDRTCAVEGIDRVTMFERLAATSGVGVRTIRLTFRGYRLARYRLAKALSDATGGAVTVEDLCT